MTLEQRGEQALRRDDHVEKLRVADHVVGVPPRRDHLGERAQVLIHVTEVALDVAREHRALALDLA